MTFDRRKRNLVGWLALLAPIPLPFNRILEWPVLFLYLLVLILFLDRSRRQARWLPTWAMNLLAAAYLPLLFIDLRLSLARGQVVSALVHLGLFAVVVKLFGMRKDRDLWQTFAAVFFIFLAAMGTSTHPTAVLYLLVFVALALHFLVRQVIFSMVASFGAGELLVERADRVPVNAFLAATLASALFLAVPLFVLFPRLNDPFVGLRGGGTGTIIPSTGFTDEVTLDSIGARRDNPEIVLRLSYRDGARPPAEPRFKGRSYEIYEARRWRTAPSGENPIWLEDGHLVLSRRSLPVAQADLWLQPLNSRAVILPSETVAVDFDVPMVSADQVGTVSLVRSAASVLSYTVSLADEPILWGQPPRRRLSWDDSPAAFARRDASKAWYDALEDERAGIPALDLTGLTPRIAALADEVLRPPAPASGEASSSASEAAIPGEPVSWSPAQKAEALETYLINEYDFSTTFIGRTGDQPLENFLFRYRQGHCELFASAMVLMLRSQGIPARLATGFLGAEYNPLTGYFVVRQGNAHAWVEAWLPETGWRIFDPTPPVGRPTMTGLTTSTLAAQAWDYLLFRWDRYVLTYGFEDQLSALWRFRSTWVGLRQWFAELELPWSGEESPDPQTATAAGDPVDPGATVQDGPPAAGSTALGFWILLTLAVAAALTVYLLARRRTGLTGVGAFQHLRRAVRRRGLGTAASTPPLALQRRIAEACPGAEAPSARVIDAYLRESFGGRELSREERSELAEALSASEKALAAEPELRKAS